MIKFLNLFKILKFILSHPLNRNRKGKAVTRFIRWQIGSRIAPGSILVKFIGESRLIAEPGLAGATGNVYTGLYEFEDMAFVLHCLRKDDLLVDIGANIGTYTILASSVIGARCMAIEPIPSAFKHLCDNVNINGIYDRARCLKIGISNTAGILRFTTSYGSMNHVSVNGNANSNTIEVPVKTLNEVIGDFEAFLLKIDVEGYETRVIEGADDILAKENLHVVLMELRGHGKRYGFDESMLHKRMLGYGFISCRYFPFTREIVENEGIDFQRGNTLYIREKSLSLIERRVQSAPKFSVFNHEF